MDKKIRCKWNKSETINGKIMYYCECIKQDGTIIDYLSCGDTGKRDHTDIPCGYRIKTKFPFCFKERKRSE